ncbi:unnamed protein product [Meganyctiphanes norvegica]|uniref:Cuticle protein n=1 Tax=Meganyctiphanes norvegica TaxID=48144 RepID=A0AAV2QUU9_MEGNR
MNPILLLVSLAAVASAGVVPVPYAFPGSVAVRAPSHDSAIIQSHRLGGNFAYRTDEAHAYAVQTPVLGQRTVPVGVSYHQGTPIVRTSTDYVSHFVPQTGIATYQAPAQVISQPIVQQQAVVGAVPSIYHHGVVGTGAVVGGAFAAGAAFPTAYATGYPHAFVGAHGPIVGAVAVADETPAVATE